jgi:ABC-type multidrug transport system fused ATPase/permease subunit
MPLLFKPDNREDLSNTASADRFRTTLPSSPMSAPPAQAPPPGPSDARRLFQYVLQYRTKLLLGAGALLAAAGLQLIFPMIAGHMVQGTIVNVFGDAAQAPPEWFRNIWTTTGIMAVLVVGILVFSYWGIVLFSEIGERALADLRAATYERLMLLPMAFFARHRAGDLSSRILNDLSQIQELWIHDLRQLLRFSALTLGGILLMFATSARLAGVLFAILPLIIGASFWIGKRIRTLSSRSQEQLARSAVVLEETLQAIQAVKAFHNEKLEIARYRRSLDDFLPPALRGARSRAFFVCAILLVILSTVIFIMNYGSHTIVEGWLTPGGFTTFMFYLAFAAGSGGSLAELYSKIQRVLGANSRIVAILDEPIENLDSDTPPLLSLEGRVSFRNVSFSYPSRADSPVLRGISLEAAPGERIAIVGPSGAGKSTLVSLLLRLFDPDQGEILIDGKPAREYPLGWLRARMGLVPQEVILFGGTLRENIAYGKPSAKMEEIVAAARAAHALDFIEALPEKFETMAGDRGNQLSGGQRQRIALARAFLKNPAILILDEATSALDPESEKHIQAALDGLMRGRTSFIIAHRLTTIRDADRIIVLRNGTIVESGDPQTLLDRGGHYTQLWNEGQSSRHQESGGSRGFSIGETPSTGDSLRIP